MDDARELILQDVRCFRDEQRGRLRPITLLVGENSTGKTTVLGCYRVLHRLFSGRGGIELPDFNEEPFAMGSFRDVVRSRRGPGGRIDEFRIGLRVERAPGGVPSYVLSVTFRERGSEPVVSSLRFQFDSGAFLELRSGEDGTVVQVPDRTEEAGDLSFSHVIFLLDRMAGTPDWMLSDRGIPVGKPPSQGTPTPPMRFRLFPGSSSLKPIADYLRELFSGQGAARGGRRSAARRRVGIGLPDLPELIPVAPLRSKPKRTYDPIRGTASPEGEHVPMLMMRLDRTDTPHWKSLHGDLVKFGRDAGLFADIKVKRPGKQMSDPFQLQVKVRSGSHANIMDVGYGVSQSLPILVDVLERSGGRSGRKSVFLLQQPEVHLHPRGQAELASLFVQAFRRSGNRFLIETHSDHVVDRVRISVRKGLLKPDDVSILYFEPGDAAVAIRNLTLDEHGNLLDAPPGYRGFFEREADELLGFAD